MQRDDFTIIKQQIAEEILKENDDVDGRYYHYRDPLSVTLTIGDGILNPPLSEDLLRERIKRCLEIEHNRVIGSQHFSQASYECIQAFRSGMFLSCVMLTHSVNEGIIKFVADRNLVKRTRNLPDTLNKLVSLNLITNACAQASEAIWRSYRNDIHHMNPGISKIQDWHEFAKRNLRNLATVEYCVFGHDFNQGALIPHYPQHWDMNDDEHLLVYIRCMVVTN